MSQATLGYLLLASGAGAALLALRRSSLLLALAALALILCGWYLARRARRSADLKDGPGVFDDLTGSDVDLD